MMKKERAASSQEPGDRSQNSFLEFAVKCEHRQVCNVCDLPEVAGGCNERGCPEFGLITNQPMTSTDILISLERVAEITGYTWIGKTAVQAMNEIKALREEIQCLRQAVPPHTPATESNQPADQHQTSDPEIPGDAINHPEHKFSKPSEENNGQNQNENLPGQNDLPADCAGGRV